MSSAIGSVGGQPHVPPPSQARPSQQQQRVDPDHDGDNDAKAGASDNDAKHTVNIQT